ncbi:MAG: CBS domain-containing protein [Sedimenticolaceae bacterium]
MLVLENGKVRGIVTDATTRAKWCWKARPHPTHRSPKIATTQVLCAVLNKTIEEAMALMTDKRVRHLPVLADGQITWVWFRSATW